MALAPRRATEHTDVQLQLQLQLHGSVLQDGGFSCAIGGGVEPYRFLSLPRSPVPRGCVAGPAPNQGYRVSRYIRVLLRVFEEERRVSSQARASRWPVDGQGQAFAKKDKVALAVGA